MRAYAETPIRDEGSVVVFEGFDNDEGNTLTFAVDHRMAQAIVEYLGEYEEACPVEIDAWQILSR